jgi:hypothetical protein
MTTWTINKKNNNYSISRSIQDGPIDRLGNAGPGLHFSLASIAEFFEPGDIVTTPEGSGIVAKKLEGLN